MRKHILLVGYFLPVLLVAGGALYMVYNKPLQALPGYAPAEPVKERYYAAADASDYSAAQKAFDEHQALMNYAIFSSRDKHKPQLRYEAAEFGAYHAETAYALGKTTEAMELLTPFIAYKDSTPAANL